MALHCAQKFKSLRCATETKRMEVTNKHPQNYANGKINITTRNGKTPIHANGIIPPHAG